MLNAECSVFNIQSDQNNIREFILFGHLLRPQMFFYCDGIVRAALDRAVISHDNTGHALDHTNAGDDATSGHVGLGIELVAGEGRELHEGGSGIYQRRDPIPREHLLSRNVLLPGLGRAAGLGGARQLLQPGHGLAHETLVLTEFI